MTIKEEYQRIISFLKYTVSFTAGAITVMVGVALYITGNDRSTILQSVRDIKNESIDIIKKNETNFSEELKSLRRIAEMHVEEETKKKVDEAFDKNSINLLIKEKINEEYGFYINERIDREINQHLIDIRNELSAFAELTDAASKMRIGSKEGYSKLLELSKESKYKSIRKNAYETLEFITVDYDSNANRDLRKYGHLDREVYTISKMIKRINTDEDLNRIARGFCILRKLSKVDFKMFDFEGVEIWCKKNSELCNQN